jgi:hypothetical protein
MWMRPVNSAQKVVPSGVPEGVEVYEHCGERTAEFTAVAQAAGTFLFQPVVQAGEHVGGGRLQEARVRLLDRGGAFPDPVFQLGVDVFK